MRGYFVPASFKGLNNGDTGACQEPGPYASPLAQKPLEASGAHSPPGPATSPPSQNAPAAETMGSKKP